MHRSFGISSWRNEGPTASSVAATLPRPHSHSCEALWRPRTAYREFKELGERHKAKGVEGNMVGDGLKLGGVFVFAPAAADGGDADDASPVYTYLEIAGSVPPVGEIQAAVDALVAPAAAAA